MLLLIAHGCWPGIKAPGGDGSSGVPAKQLSAADRGLLSAGQQARTWTELGFSPVRNQATGGKLPCPR